MAIQLSVTRMRANIMTWARHLTWPWLAAFVLLAACIGFYLSVVIPEKTFAY